MRLDKFKIPIFNDTDIFSLIYNGHIDSIQKLTVEKSNEINKLESISGINFTKFNIDSLSIEIADFDIKQQTEWFIPPEYLNLDIEATCLSKCVSDEERNRILEEMHEFKKRDMIPILQWMQYFVDTATENNILWGVGRGSSVSSYVLYIIGVHRINSIKYKLDWREFLR